MTTDGTTPSVGFFYLERCTRVDERVDKGGKPVVFIALNPSLQKQLTPSLRQGLGVYGAGDETRTHDLQHGKLSV